MNRLFHWTLSLALLLFAGASLAADNRFTVISYHDVVDAPPGDSNPLSTEVSTRNLEAQFAWLKNSAYRVVAIQDVVDAAQGKKSLPEKSIVLIFDDGYLSFYTKVLPLLKKYRYPAVTAVVGRWLEKDGAQDMPPRENLMTWEQIRAAQRSGLVEVASHSYDLHHGIPGNPQGNQQAAAVTRLYDAAAGRYESDDEYRRRLGEEMQKSADFIFQNTGRRPRLMVWPYGEYNAIALEASREAGMPLTVTLRDGVNTLADLSAMRRLLITRNPPIEQFTEIVTTQRAHRPLHVAHLDLDYIYDPDPAQTERNLSALLDRVRSMKINTVYLQAYADPDGDGNAEALYFPNRHLPLRSDLFNRVAWQLKTRTGVKVYAWMPVMAYKDAKIPADWYVQEWRDGQVQHARHIYQRLSPYRPEARRFVGEIYEDLAKHASFDGILFHDDGILSDYEDASPAALDYAQGVWGLPGDVAQLHGSPALRLAWAQGKTELLAQFTDELAERVRVYRPDIKTARNLYALPLLFPDSEEWYAQSFPAFLKHYDYVAIEAMPFMEKAAKPDEWLTDLAKKAAAQPGGLDKTVFELQSVDWNTGQKIPSPVFFGQMELLAKLGARHIGYYPDNVFENQPPIEDLEEHFKLPGMP
ncbi:MAG TPA: poly-beta-1,6-N-acetyl-D-glucosamine N-deacetylase PgaB [Methylococcaceae bacterium]|nr:poly-beta-1,6-N-acetyl-D-glucosamine N-deacetylase PgaB [Methylococcaceae bacterium]